MYTKFLQCIMLHTLCQSVKREILNVTSLQICTFLTLLATRTDIPYLREQGFEDPWLFFEAKRGSANKHFSKP